MDEGMEAELGMGGDEEDQDDKNEGEDAGD